MSTEAGGDPPALSPRQQTAVTNLQRHWRGLARRLHVIRKWSWAVSNGLENREEQRMVELGMFVESIAEELAMDRVGAPSLERRNTVGHKSLLAGGLKSLGFKSTEPQASGSVKSEPHEPKCDGPAFLLPPAPCCPPQEIGVARARRGVRPLLPPLLLLRPFTLRFPLREADVLELVASFCRGQQLSSGSVEQLLDLHLGVLQPLPNAGGKLQTLRPALSWGRRGPPWAAMRRRGPPWAASGEPEGPDVLPGTQLSPRRSSWRQLAAGAACMGGMHGRHGRPGRPGWPMRTRCSLRVPS